MKKFDFIQSKIFHFNNNDDRIKIAQTLSFLRFKEKKIIFTNVSRRELAVLQEYINWVDPNAFMTVINANEVLGNGFKSLKEKVEQ